MSAFEEPVGRVLEDFCHVEWYEVSELAALVKNGEASFNTNALREQFEFLLLHPNGIAMSINKLTANEFKSDDEARAWLEDIYRNVFYDL